VAFLIQNAAIIDQRSSDGATPLIWAASQGHTNVVQALLSKGAKITKKDENGKTALAHAAIQGHFSTAKVLIKFGADLNHDLLYAARRGYNKMVNFLLNEKADVDYISAKSETALTLAITRKAYRDSTNTTGTWSKHGCAKCQGTNTFDDRCFNWRN